MRIITHWLRFFPLLLFLASLTGDGLAAPAPLTVAASILPLGDFCAKIGGDLVKVQVLIPPGASPHVYEPSAQAVAQAGQARVFVYIGAGLDPWAARLLQAHPHPERQVVEASAGVALIYDLAHAEEEEEFSLEVGKKKSAPEAHRHVHVEGNPHIWLDPVLVQDLCRKIAQALSQADPAHGDLYQANLDRYLKELQGLHQEISRTVAGFRIKEYICFHPAFTYFARRYGLREAGVIELAPGREPSPGHLQKIIAAIKRTQVKAVFAEPQLSPRIAEVLAREAGVKVLLLDPLGGRPPYGNDYLQLMRYNLRLMGEALR
jgi:zinc transport system substrate-binding protein